MTEGREGFPPTGSGSSLDELRREHQVAEPLLKHLRELGSRIAVDGSTSPRDALIGVALLDAYLHRVHVGEEDLELSREIVPLAQAPYVDHLRSMHATHGTMRTRAQETLSCIRQWSAGGPGARELTGQGMIELVERDIAALRFEDAIPLTSLSEVLPEDVDLRLRSGFERHAGTRSVLEARIRQYLAGTYST